MFTTHKNNKALCPDSSRRVFLRAGSMTVLSAGLWLGGETIAFGQSEKSTFQLTRSKFTPHLSESFLVKLNGEEIYLQLIEITDLKHASINTSALSRKEDASFKAKLDEESFTLLFRSRSEVLLPQNTRKLQHNTLGQIELFLVPLDRPDGPWHFYEAVFNRLQS